MPKILDDSVSQAKDDTWTFQCPGIKGSPCGDRQTKQPFVSSQWPTQKAALARGREHFDEHKGIAVASSLEDFRAKHGLTVDADGVVTVEEI